MVSIGLFILANSPRNRLILDYDVESLIERINPLEWRNLWNNLTNRSGGDIRQHWIPETIRSLAYKPQEISTVIIPAIRKIGDYGTDSEPEDFSGEGIIERLAKLQNPTVYDVKDKLKFKSINDFLKIVLEKDDVQLEIPHDRKTINVIMDNKMLPIESLGTGIHEAIILAAASTILEDAIISMKNLNYTFTHGFKKKLINYLNENTNNQYFITSHSTHILDTLDASILHVTHDGNSSYIESKQNTKDKSDIASDLGYRASDILQANCIIWVEGPSDRIYIKAWIRRQRL